MNKIAAMSCRLDKGEDLKHLVGQIERMADTKVSHYFLDIICKPAQLLEAHTLLLVFYRLLETSLPDLPKESVFTAITCNQDIRPCRAIAAIIIQTLDKIVDTNPTREESWVKDK